VAKKITHTGFSDEDKTVISPHSEKTLRTLQKRSPVLSVVHGNDKGKMFILNAPQTVGRSDPADIIVDDKLISRQHFSVSCCNDTFRIEDLHSTNGTYIEGKKLDTLSIPAGCLIQAGKTVFCPAFKTDAEINSEKELFQSAVSDSLTGIANQKWFRKRANEEFQFAKSKGLPLSIAMIDIDFFKKINDTYGHPSGDSVIKEIVEIVKKECRDDDKLGRYGGEEFILLLKGIDGDNAQRVCGRIRENIEKHSFAVTAETIQVTVSIGLCSMHGSEISDLESAIRDADTALYRAKESGRNKVCSAHES